MAGTEAQEQLLPGATPPSSGAAAWDMRTGFPTALTSALVVLMACFAAFTRYGDDVDTDQNYMYLIHVSVMIFVGFGFLMTFLKRYSLSAVSLNFVSSCMMALAAILLVGLARSKLDRLQAIPINIESLIEGLFCAGAGMISFGALLGKASPTQVLLLLLLEVPLYVINSELLVSGAFGRMGAQDVGGSMAIHAFGAYYGLSASWVLFRRSAGAGGDHESNHPSRLTDLEAMIGTIFLWVYWPSFNAALAVSTSDAGAATGTLRMYAAANTVLALCGATLSSFAACGFLKGKLDAAVVQNATLAGGVAVGSAATMVLGDTVLNVGPGGALTIGAAAGVLSTFGFCRLSPFLEARIGLKDTCGVHNLHGLPGLLGGLVPGVPLLLAGASSAAAAQVAALGATVAIAGAGGAVHAWFVSFLGGAGNAAQLDKMYDDDAVFEGEGESEKE